jgi:class 3 adenylate cyclase/tetratricopeptide (TPR) repeat protein
VPVSGRNERVLMAVLAMSTGEVVGTDRLVDALWGAQPPRSSAKVLQNTVLRLRKALGPELIATRQNGYLLAGPSETVDAVRFEHLVAQGRVLAVKRDWLGALARFRDARQLWRGTPLPELENWGPGRNESARLAEVYHCLVEDLADAELAAGHHHQCVSMLETMVSEEPLRERRWSLLMLALYRDERQADALRTFQRARTALGEIGLEPGPALRELERAVVDQRPELQWSVQASRSEAVEGHPPSPARPSGTVTFMFTDIEDSTGLWIANPGAMRVALARHEQILRTAIAAHDGFVFAPAGDGIGAAFWRSADAIGAALDGQRVLLEEVWPDDIVLPVRMGLHTGEAEERDGNYFGPPVNRAVRVMNEARGGEILVSSTTVDIFGSAQDFELVDAGVHPLKGFAEPAQLFSVRVDGMEATYERIVTPTAARRVLGRAEHRTGQHDLPLPELLRLTPEFSFVPRPDSWAAFEAAWTDASAGSRRLVLVAGEPGIGKTRLVTEFGRSVHDRGGGCLYGACADEIGLPYQPFVEALEHLLEHADETLRAAVRQTAPDLARLVPKFFGGDVPPAAEEEPEAARYRLFSAVTAALTLAARQRPILLVLDDVHWAGQPTIQLLAHLSRTASLPGLCVVAVYRTTPSDIGESLRSALPDLRRHPATSSVTVHAFDRDGVGKFVASAAGHEIDDRLDPVIDILESQTAGNPFLLGELWRDLTDTGRVARVDGRCAVTGPLDQIRSPGPVRDVVRGRLHRLPAETHAVLQTAAVMGTSFPTSVLAAAVELDARTVFADLEPAFGAGLVEDSGPDECRFTHALVRQSVYDELTSGERRERHFDVARALEGVFGEGAAAQIAHHYVAGIPVADLDVAVAATRRAAAAAMRAVAYHDAAAHLDAVIAIAPESVDRCRLLLEAADAHTRAGDIPAAQARAVEASALGRRFGVPDLIVAAAVAFEDASWHGGLPGAAAEELLHQALPLAADAATRVRLQGSLSRALAFSGKPAEAHATADDALAGARKLDDRRALYSGLLAVTCAPWSPETLGRQLAANRELLALARADRADEVELQALSWLVFYLLITGEFEEFRRTMGAYRERADQSAELVFRVYLLQTESAVALAEGRFEEAQRLAVEASDVASRLAAMDVSGGFGVQMFSIQRERGALEQVRPVVETIAQMGHESATWKTAVALLYAELGLTDSAARLLQELTADDLRLIPRDALWCGSLTYVADVATILQDREAADVIYASLEPFAGLVVPLGWCVSFQGSADRYLGALAGLLDRPTVASDHFEAALELDSRSGMAVWLARTQVAYAKFLTCALDAPDRARPLIRAARITADALALAPLQRELERLSASS